MGKKKVNLILCDSNVLFNFLRGDEKTKKALKTIGEERIAFSIITTAEAYAGSNKVDFAALKAFFGEKKVFYVNEEVSKIFNGLIQSNHRRHSKWIPDALIASTAIAHNIELFTYNRKDFDFIDELKLYNP